MTLWQCDFVYFDDGEYVFNNPMVQGGLSWAGVKWAFTTYHSGNWHPMTWLSLMLDRQLWGGHAVAYHATNLGLHVASSVILFLVLQRLTQARWPSALAGAFFALHPMHVESVAWISERKDVLSAFFAFLSIWAYAVYAQRRTGGAAREEAGGGTVATAAGSEAGAGWFYALSLVFFALGLMAK